MNEEYLELLFSAYGSEVGDDYEAFKTAMSNEDYSRMLFETHSEELGDDYAEFNKAAGINIEPYVEEEEEVSISGEYGVKEQDVFQIPEPSKSKFSKDISYEDFNSKGQNSAFDNAEENLEDKLSTLYPDLTFDTPIMNGGVSNDMLDVTNKDGEVFSWKMNTDYNSGKRDSDGDYTVVDPENREQESRDNYINFLEFANESKYKDGKYQNPNDIRTLGPDYMVKNNQGQDVEMQVTPGLTKKAISIMKSNPDVTSLDEAIDLAVDTEFGQMNIAWQGSIQNKKAKKNFDFKNEVKSLVSSNNFNPNIVGDDLDGDTNKTIETLESLGMPKEVISSAVNTVRVNRQGQSLSPKSDAQEKLNNVRAWLDGSQTWGENTEGPLITKAYNELIDQRSKEQVDNDIKQSVIEAGVNQEQVIKRQQQLLNAEGNTLSEEQALVQANKDVVALTVQDIKTKKAKEDGDRILKAELPYYDGKSRGKIEALQSELAEIKKLEEGQEKAIKYKEYLSKVRDFLDDDEINLLKQGDKFVRKDRQEQLNNLNSNAKNIVKDLLLDAPDKLDEKLLDTDTELLNLAKEIKRKGLSETINEGSILQMFGAAGQEFVGAEGSAFEDFRKIEKWIETGEMPDLLTPLPVSTTDSYLFDNYGDASGQDPLIKKYNDLLEYRSTLLLAQSLNADPTSFGKTESGVGRFLEGVVEATPEAIGMNNGLTKDKQRELGFDILEDVYGIKKTDKDKANLYQTEHDLWKSSGKMIPGLTRMGAEIYLTTLATGGVGFGPAVLRAATFRTLLRSGVSSGIAKNIATYGGAVMTEYIGLQGSNAMERSLDFGPGIENPELFALTASAIRLKGAQASSKFNKAIIDTYKTGSNAQRNALEYFYAFPTTASTEAGALKYTGSLVDRSVKSLSRTTMAAGSKITGAAGGAITISTADNVGAVLAGDKTVAQALNDVTNPDHLMELGGALLFLGMSRPDKYSKQTIERFRTEVDLIRGNNPQWNKLRRSLGMKTVSDKSEEYSQGEEAFSERVNEALELKKEEINNSDKTESQKSQEISALEFNANRLKLKIPLDVLAKDLANPAVMGSYKELEQAAYAVSVGGFNAKNLSVIEAASFTSDGTSGVKMLEFYGLDAAQAQQVVDFSYSMRDVAKRHFQGDLTNANFQKYIDESITESRLESSKEKIKKDYEAKRIDKADYETQIEEIDAQLDINLNSKKQLLETAKVERAGKELEKIEEYKKAGFEIKEMNDAEMKKFMEDNGGNFSSTGFGYQGVVNGKSIALINTDATARENVGGTEVHEIWHHPFERRLGSEAMASRIESLMKNEKLTKEQAAAKVDKEARDYLDNFVGALKDRGILSIVSAEMAKRPGFSDAVLEQIVSGKEVPLSELKEFLNEFIQLNENGAFNNLKSEAQRKASEKQSTKDLTEKEYQEALNDPAKFVDFVLNGKYNSKNINEFLKREADELGAESKTTNLQASDKTSDVNELALAYESEGGNELWKTFGADDAIKQMKEKDSEGLGMLDRLIASKSKDFEGAPEGFVDKVYAELVPHIRNYKPERQNESGLFGWINPQIRNKANAVYNREYKKSEIDQKSKRLSDKVDKEGNREFDVADQSAREAVESAGESKSTATVETDRQISQFEGKEAKAKQQEILDIYKKELEPGTDINKTIMARKGVSGIPRRKNAAVAGLLFNVDGNRIVDPTKNPTFSKKLINEKGETIPKGSKEKGIGFSDSEFGNIQKYFSDNANLNRFLKTMMKYSFVPNQARINSKGETIEISKDVKGRGLGLPNRFVDYFFETFKDPSGDLLSPSGRTKGSKVQLQPGQAKRLKSEFINPTPEVLNKIKKDLLIGEDLANYDRTIHGQFAKGMAGVEALKTSSEALRKSLSTENKQLEADLRAGLGNLQASEKIEKSIKDSIKDPKLKITDLIKINKLNKKEAKLVGRVLKLGLDNKKDLLQIIGEAKRDLLKNKEIVEEADRSPVEIANVEKQYTAWKKAYPEIAKKFGIKDIEYIAKPESALFEGDLKERSLKNLQSASDIFPAIKKLNTGGAKYLAQAIEAFLGIGNIKIDGKRLSREAIDELLDGKGKGEVKEWMTRVFQPNWNTVGLKKQWKQVLKEANEKFDPKSQEFKDFVTNNGRDILTHPDLRGTENGFELTQEANREAIKSLLKGLKDRYRKNPTKESLEDLARLLQLQTNHQKGILGGLVPMEYVTMVEAAGVKDPAKTLHNEHMKEKFNVSDDFLSILSKYKNDLSNPKVNLAIDRLVSEMSQALTTYEGKEFKDSKAMGGPAKSNSANKMINTYLLKGSAETSLNLSGKGKGKTIADQFIEDYGLPILRKQLSKYEFRDLNTEGVKLKQKVDNSKEFAKVKKNNIEVAKEATMNASEKLTDTEIRNELNKRDKAISLANKINKKPKKIRVFDFDDTVGVSKNKVFANKDGKKVTLNAEEFAKKGLDLIDKGWEMDFSDFNKVTEGGKGPLFDLMKTMKEAKGDRDMFILTARASEAAPAIHRFLKEMGIDIPIENIIGLGKSTGEAKADWIIGKAAEGYNDFYFADDAPQNVKAVRDALEVIDVKSQVQQARMNASEKLSEDFNKILEEKTGIGAEKVFSDIKAEIRGNKARKQKFFIPPSAEDFLGLLYATLPKGKKGEAALDFYQKNLFDPYTRATDNLSRDRVNLMADFKALKKELDVPADLRKETKSGFTNEQAVRVYMWGKEGKDVPGLSKSDFKELTEIIESDAKLKSFADQIFEITKGDGYNTPGKDWGVGTITTDLIEVLNKTKRAKYLEPWKENADVIFSKENLNKLEAAYGKKYRESMENVLARMKSGSNRTAGGNRLSNQVLDYINNSTGVTMFLNTRSALLQTISAANFVNWSFNNPLMAGKAFANQPRYWKDFTKLINSDYLVDRRNGLKLNINESEIADAAKTSKNKAKAALNYILEKGYLPTKYADSFAIASGGAMFYRNRINDLVKKGFTISEAEAQAMKEFRQVSEKSQQSSDPSKISSQQSGDLGRIILQYANTPMQYARIQKRAVQDIINGRGDMKANVSKIIYYGFLQNLLFNALQQGSFALGFGDDFSDKDKDDKLVNTVNGMLDSSLRGLGLGGVSVQVLKNLGLDIYKRSKRDRPEYSDSYYKLLEFSPAIKSKLSRFKSAAYPFDSKKRRAEVFDKGFSLDNPAYESMAKVVTAVTNVPLDRMYLKIDNLKSATAEETETWMSVANVLGWPTWQLEPKEYNKANGVSSKSTVPKVKTKSEKIDKLKSMTYIQLRNKAKKEGKEYSGKNKKELINILKKNM